MAMEEERETAGDKGWISEPSAAGCPRLNQPWLIQFQVKNSRKREQAPMATISSLH